MTTSTSTSVSASASAYLDLKPYLPDTSNPNNPANPTPNTPFSATARASTLLHATLPTAALDPPPLPLAPALTRLLFDAQELDTRIDNLTTASASPLLTHTDELISASGSILQEVERNVAVLVRRYERLEREVGERWREAGERLVVAERIGGVLGMARKVARGVGLGRRLVGEVDDGVWGKARDHRAMVRAAETVVGLRKLFGDDGDDDDAGGGGDGRLERVDVMVVLRERVVAPREQRILALAQQIVREFAMSSLVTAAATATTSSMSSAQMATSDSGSGSGSSNTMVTTEKTQFAKIEDTKSRMISALSTLYLLSPLDTHASVAGASGRSTTEDEFRPTLLLAALQTYLQTALTSSLAALTRSLATLATLERTLLEISARCQNIVALERLLKSTRPPRHPLLQAAVAATRHRRSSSASSSSDDALSLSLSENDKGSNGSNSYDEPHSDKSSVSSAEANNTSADEPSFLTPLLTHLDTSSLPSFFWRSLASSLSSRVREIINKGGVSARTLRSNKDRVRDAIRQCVYQGSRLPAGSQWVGINNSSYAGPDASTSKQKRKMKQAEAETVENWEREAAVMVGAATGPLGR